MEGAVDSFLNLIKIFNSLKSHGKRDLESPETTTVQRLNSTASLLRTSSASTNFNQTPENVKEIETELDMLWKAMEQWLSILQNEISQLNEKQRSDSGNSSPDDSQENISSSGSFRSSLKSTTLLRSISKTSLNLEQLRLSQPAYTVNQRENENQVYYTRSQSYTNALSDISDDFEKTLSNENVSDAPKTPQENFITFDPRVFELTADRLCAAIHGYHLYCSVQASWEKT